ncbi:hypothetical protein [Ornithinimicrobium kibberense]
MAPDLTCRLPSGSAEGGLVTCRADAPGGRCRGGRSTRTGRARP